MTSDQISKANAALRHWAALNIVNRAIAQPKTLHSAINSR